MKDINKIPSSITNEKERNKLIMFVGIATYNRTQEEGVTSRDSQYVYIYTG